MAEQVIHVPSAMEAKHPTEQLIIYMEHNRNTEEHDITAASKLKRRLNELAISVAKQTQITSYFKAV